MWDSADYTIVIELNKTLPHTTIVTDIKVKILYTWLQSRLWIILIGYACWTSLCKTCIHPWYSWRWSVHCNFWSKTNVCVNLFFVFISLFTVCLHKFRTYPLIPLLNKLGHTYCLPSMETQMKWISWVSQPDKKQCLWPRDRLVYKSGVFIWAWFQIFSSKRTALF